MIALEESAQALQRSFSDDHVECTVAYNEITLCVPSEKIVKVCRELKERPLFQYEILIDVCAVDYLHYGLSEWETEGATAKGFERAVRPISEVMPQSAWKKPRFAVVYHLLSITRNQRLRVKAFVPDEALMMDSLVEIYASANWFEREAFDLYGILFKNHPDLRRILTDYGFIGHPFRKDFPLVGNVEVRFDANQQRVIYEPVDIVPRTLVPKVIRKGTDHGGN